MSAAAVSFPYFDSQNQIIYTNAFVSLANRDSFTSNLYLFALYSTHVTHVTHRQLDHVGTNAPEHLLISAMLVLLPLLTWG